MKQLLSIGFISLLLVGRIAASAAPFQNLDFEATTLPRNGPSSLQPFSVALPGWRGFLGAHEETDVFFNLQLLSGGHIDLSGTSFPVLQGRFSVLLWPGPSPINGQPVESTLSQAGRIPDNMQTLRFLGVVGYFGPQPMPLDNLLGVYVNDQRLAVTDAFVEPGSYNYSADISAYAGQDVTLKFTSFNVGPFGPNSLILDSISFSTVPEPSTLALFTAAGVLGWCCRRRKRAAPPAPRRPFR